MRRAARKLVKLTPVKNPFGKNPFARHDRQLSKLVVIAERIKQYEAGHEKTC
jgi:hypothetical protein